MSERCIDCGRTMVPTMLVGPPLHAQRFPDGYTCGTPCPGRYRGPDAVLIMRQSLALAAAKC